MADCAQNCPIAQKVDRLEEQLDEFQAQNGDSHREIYGRLNALERASDVQGAHYNVILDKLDGLGQKVDALEQKPAKRWETAAAAAVSAIVSGVTVFLLAGGHIG